MVASGNEKQEMSDNVTLTAKQTKFLHELLDGKKIADAAKEADIAERTAYRWLNDAAFTEVYERSRKQLLNQSLASLHAKFGKAVETLETHLDSKTTIPRDQLKSAEIVVNTTIQTAQLMERIAELEAQLAQREQEEQYIVKFDTRKLLINEQETLRRINANVVARETI